MMGQRTAGTQAHCLPTPASLSPQLPPLLALHGELLCSDVRSFGTEAGSHGRKEKSLEPKGKNHMTSRSQRRREGDYAVDDDCSCLLKVRILPWVMWLGWLEGCPVNQRSKGLQVRFLVGARA